MGSNIHDNATPLPHPPPTKKTYTHTMILKRYLSLAIKRWARLSLSTETKTCNACWDLCQLNSVEVNVDHTWRIPAGGAHTPGAECAGDTDVTDVSVSATTAVESWTPACSTCCVAADIWGVSFQPCWAWGGKQNEFFDDQMIKTL